MNDESRNENMKMPNANAQTYPFAEDDCHQYCQDGTPATRLVDLLPGASSDDLRCILRSVRLDNMASYEALSYAWKDDDDIEREELTTAQGQYDKQPVLVNSRWYLDVSNGLMKALLALRDTKLARTLWIDQLCINQSDAHEKSFQVAQMAEIYSKARSVILWTGNQSADTKFAYKTIEVLADIWQEYGSLSPENAEVEDQYIKNNTHGNYASIPLLVSFFMRRVFTRGWVVQEVILAKHIIVKCGEMQMEWDAVDSATRSLAAIGRRQGFDPFSTETQDGEKTTPIWHTVELRRKVRGQGCVTLLDALEAVWHFKTTDPRDKVFAALGMCELAGTMKDILKIDYTLSASEIFLQASKAIIFGEKTLGAFSTAGMLVDRIQGLPTWVTDWSAARTGFQSTSVSRERKFSAAKGIRGVSCWPVATSLPHPYPMVSVSFNFAKVDYIQGRTAPKGSVGSYTSTIQAWHNMVLTGKRAYGGEKADRAAFLRTLIYPFPKTWRSEGSVSGKDYESIVMPGLEGLEQAMSGQHDYELDLLQVALQIVFNTDDDSYFYDFKLAGPEGVDKPVLFVYEDGIMQEAKSLPNGDQIVTVEQLANAFYVFKGDIASMVKTIKRAVDNNVFFITSNGYFGLGPIGMLEDDEIHLIGGSDIPLVFRTANTSDITLQQRYLVCECYVHGIMYGEALDLPEFMLDLLTIH